jgi:hypothetical protein
MAFSIFCDHEVLLETTHQDVFVCRLGYCKDHPRTHNKFLKHLHTNQSDSHNGNNHIACTNFVFQKSDQFFDRCRGICQTICG